MTPITLSLASCGRTDRCHVAALAKLRDDALVAVISPGGSGAPLSGQKALEAPSHLCCLNQLSIKASAAQTPSPAPPLTEDIVLRDYAQRMPDFQTRLMRILYDLMRSLLGRSSCWQQAEAHAGQIESQRQRHARANDEAGAERVPATACRMKARNADGTPAAFPSHETAWATSSKDHQHLKIECRQYSSSACGEPHANEQNPSNLAGTCCIVHQHIRYKQDTSNAT